LQPIDEPRVLGDQGLPLAFQMPSVFVRVARDADDVPDPALAFVPAHQHGDQLPRVEPIGLRPSLPPIHFDRRRIDHDVGNAARQQGAMHPEAVTAGLIATHDRCRRREPEAPPGPLEFRRQRVERPGCHLSDPRDLPSAGRQGERPATLAEFECEEEHLAIGRGNFWGARGGR
jgi:hypothetical protein